MLVTFKCITQEQFTEEFDENVTVADMKQKVQDVKGEATFSAANQKLIYNGKVLVDDCVLKDIGYDEKKFLVMIVKKAVPPPVAAPEPAKEEATKEKSAEATPATPAPAVVPETPANRPPADTPAAPRRPAVHPDHQQKLNDLMAMGYPEAEATAALRAAFFNSERAVEYLLTGIPDAVRNELDMDEGDAADEEEPPRGLDFLMDNEQFTQLRELVRGNPEALPQLIQQIAVDNPQLMQLIRENEQQFLEILNADGEGEEHEAAGGVEAEGGEQQLPPNAVLITQADQDAINRLKDMGFPQDVVVEAYFACDKNEGLAVNYILSRMEEAYDEAERQQP